MKVKIITIVVMVGIFSLLFSLAVVPQIRTARYCDSLDYDYIEVLDDKFNCCSSEIIKKSVDEYDEFYYFEEHSCIAGGNYPIKRNFEINGVYVGLAFMIIAIILFFLFIRKLKKSPSYL